MTPDRPQRPHFPGDFRADGRARYDRDAELLSLSERVERLTVSRRDPERFYEEKSEIAHELRLLAKAVR